MINKYIFGSAIAASLLLAGCGSGGDDTTTDTSTSTTGYVVDSAVANMDYDCVADNDMNKVTDANGAFTCQNMSQVRFRLGDLVLGEINSLPADKYVFPQDILGVDRNNTLQNTEVTAMAQLLQSLDENRDPSDGIVISNEHKEALEEAHFNAEDLADYLNEASVEEVSQTDAQNHLRESLQTIIGKYNKDSNSNVIQDIINMPFSSLTQDLKDALAHMGNEERLAYDVYFNLYNYHNNNGTDITQLYNISQNSEKTHVGIVQSLVLKYNLSSSDLTNVDTSISDNTISFEDMPSGTYDIPAIQALYDTLYAKGTASKQDALEVGCMVEVVDVTDLDEYIQLAEDSNAEDVTEAFNVLRDGSYSHYWAFDKGLKNMGITDGCCSLGSEWCHTEYPQTENGNGSGNGTGTGNGHGRN
jgi:hypothetical protein